ncbi:uncharacterized protein RJT21DRAFT_123160 [Scheffersomyces amazonensis]|uniref:uncharacterized protein n=1 Tax=Scheffersomyces amazonensis TaxID=1078765 RepID=UPI00315C8477
MSAIVKKRIRRLPPDKRQKVSTACDSCKKRKFRCTGEKPCETCVKKGYECTYTIVDKRSLKAERMAKLKLMKSQQQPEQQLVFDNNQNATQLIFNQQAQVHLQPVPQLNELDLYNDHLSPNTIINQQQVHQQQHYVHNHMVSPRDSLTVSSVSTVSPPNNIDSPSNTYIPKSLQPLLSFPLNDNEQENENENENENGSENELTRDHGSSSSSSSTPNSAFSLNSAPSSSSSQQNSPSPDIPSYKISYEQQKQIQEQKSQADVKSQSTSTDGGVSNQNGKCIILLNDKSGTFRFMGETAPLSLLYESRNIVIQYIGAGSNFTEKLQCCPVIDRPDLPPQRILGNQLPKFEDAKMYVEYFKRNINDSFFVFNMHEFNQDYLNMIYNHDELIPDDEKKRKLIILYLVLAIGSLYSHYSQYILDSPRSQALFDNAIYLLQDTVQDSELWVVIANYLIFHYYQGVLKKSTAWIHLNLAIKFAQSLGMHRMFVNDQFNYKSEDSEYKKKLFRSLYASDRMSSIFIGRPLSVNDYDYDDPILTSPNANFAMAGLDFNSKCQIELTRICHIVGKIVANFYQGRIIDIHKAKKLAIELKIWSMNLDEQLSINNIFNADTSINNNENHQNTHILLLVHLMQLWAIMLLSRPYFMFEAAAKLNPSSPGSSTLKNRKLSIQFYKAAVKASILAIKLVNYYMNTAYKQIIRRECYAIITCCFYGSLVLGIAVLHGGFADDDHSEMELIDTLKMASNMLHEFTPTNKGAERYEDIVNDLIEVLLVHRQRRDSDITITTQDFIGKQLDKELESLDFRVLNDYNFIDDPTNNLESLVKFQQFFVSPELLPNVEVMAAAAAAAADINSPGNDFSFLGSNGSTTMPHDYGNYELLYGDKY